MSIVHCYICIHTFLFVISCNILTVCQEAEACSRL